MALLVETRGGNVTVIKCSDCGGWEHQRPGARIRHSRRCDTPHLQPTPEQCGVTVASTVEAKGTVKTTETTVRDVTWVRGRTPVDSEYYEKLRRAGHSDWDIECGNTDF